MTNRQVRGVLMHSTVTYGINGRTYTFTSKEFSAVPILVLIQLNNPPRIIQTLYKEKVTPFQPMVDRNGKKK